MLSVAGFFLLREYTRTRVNEQLPPMQKLRIGDGGIFEVVHLYKQFYPESNLPFWYWSRIVIALGSWGLGVFLERAARH